MKIKGRLKCSLSKLLIIYAVVGVVFTALRFYQRLALTDPATGFFTDKGNFTVILFYVLWFVTVLGFSLTSFMCGDIPEKPFAGQRNFPHAVVSVLFAVTLVLTGIERIKELLSEAGGTGLIAYVKAQKEWVEFFYAVFAVLGAVSLILDGFAFITGNNFIGKLKIVRLFPVFWAFCLSIGYFGITVSYIHVTQVLLDIFAGVFLMLFLFEYARFISDIAIREAGWSVIATGTIAAVMLFSSSLPDFFFVITGQSDKLVVNCPMLWFNLAGGIYVITALYTVIKNRSLAEINIAPLPADDEKKAASDAE